MFEYLFCSDCNIKKNLTQLMVHLLMSMSFIYQRVFFHWTFELSYHDCPQASMCL